MKRAILTLLALAALLTLPATGDKQEVLDRISSLIDEGEFDEAKRMIDFFLGKNPGDEAILRLLEVWRIRKGDLGPLLSEKDLDKPAKRERLREICIGIVRATLRGNPEEWAALPRAVSPGMLRELLEPLAKNGSPEDRRIARELINPPPPAPPPPPDEIVVQIRKGPMECLSALRWAERLGTKEALPFAKKIFAGTRDTELRFAAAAVLLTLGDDSPRKTLEAALATGTPPEALEALGALLRHPGAGKKPIQALFASIEGSEVPGRVKPTMRALALDALGNSQEEGAREFLEARLGSVELRVDAARALGALGDADAVPALIAYLKAPPPKEEGAAGGGLDFLGNSPGLADASAADELRPRLVGALAVLRLTRDEVPK